ncbi:SURF1 family protein [Plastoroseomonas arctica]|uniref:SURF1-like protein n=1 Tax=Plastoroseomonas arctica TaxID=1509237 RepID=A0AAF1K6F5_9PROT|nr:SURF1 family cytochrome oxidase biogenesis protein [Plastoroseomonas arctica]MBR0657324.1 SURF1 family protein [Plastoroseomonas arctica]
MRRLLVPVLVVLPAFLILLGLGTWQLQRLAWKTELLAAIAAAEAGPAAPLGPVAVPFTKVAAAGRFDHAREVILGVELRGTVLGTRLLTPLVRMDAATVLVDRGWVPLDASAPIVRPEGEVTVTGWVRPAEPGGLFAATDDLAGRRFYSFDPEKIGHALGLARVAPFGLVALGEAAAEVLPDPSRTLPRPNNNHLGYVVTWYGLALALLVVFAIWARRRMRETP